MSTMKKLNEQIAKAKEDIRQHENKVKQLVQKQKEQERKERTRRLIERGAILESLIDEPTAITNEQIKTLLQSVLTSAAAREKLNAFHTANAAANTANVPPMAE